MVQVGVGFDPSKEVLTQLDNTIVSACTGITVRFIAQPIDLVKIRFQLQVEPINAKNTTSKYRGFWQAIRTIGKEEGYRALWKGHMSGQYLSIVYSGIQFTSFELLTEETHKFLHGNDNSLDKKNLLKDKHYTGLSHPNDPITYTKLHEPEGWGKIFEHLFCGAVCGCFATAASFPLDVIRTRIVSQGNPKVYNNSWDAFQKIRKLEGYRGFYKGLQPSLIQIVPYSALMFGLNRLFKQLWHDYADKIKPKSQKDGYKNYMQKAYNILESGFCGSAAGFAAKFLVYPLDLLKKRLQVQGFGYARKEFGGHHDYKSLLDGIKKIYRTEKLLGFYKGFLPAAIKAGVSSGVQFMVYEQLQNWLLDKKLKEMKKQCD